MSESFVGFGTAHVEVTVDLVRFDVFIRAGVATNVHYAEWSIGVERGNSRDTKAELAIYTEDAELHSHYTLISRNNVLFRLNSSCYYSHKVINPYYGCEW